MKKFAVATTFTFTLLLAGLGIALTGSNGTDGELRRVDCETITMFTPAHNKSAEELCENYGGVAKLDAKPNEEGLIILVRNQPMGGFSGGKAVR